MSQPFKILQLSPAIYSLCFESTVDFDLYGYAKQLKNQLSQLQEVMCTFDRISLFFTTDQSAQEVEKQLCKIKFKNEIRSTSSMWEVPIYFGKHHTDLLHYFDGKQEAVDAYRKQFLTLNFRLSFYGFLPGFGYLSGLPKAMHLDRKSSPVSIEKGDVAIGGGQVGIYPQASPGGWQQLGNCPAPWINLKRDPHVQISPGDSIRFVEIDNDHYHAILAQVDANQFEFKKFPQ